MALGGGTFTTQNKVLPGAYINVVSAARARTLMGSRGIVTMGLELNWGPDGVVKVTEEELRNRSMEMFGYAYDSKELSEIRDILCNATTLYAYRLNAGGNKAENDFATANYAGTRGNDIRIVIQVNVDTPGQYDVKTYLGTTLVDKQTVATPGELEANSYVSFKKDAELRETAGMQMEGGTNAIVTGEEHASYLTAIEPYTFHAIGVATEDSVTNRMYAAFAKRMRDEVGAKFQCVLYGEAADHEGVINVKNGKEVVPWVLGAEGGCAINKTCTNKKYTGEAEVATSYTQDQLKEAIQKGEFVLHRVGDDICVLEDINSFVSVTEEKTEVLQSNQSIRVIDQIANDIAALFNTRYLGLTQNNLAGRNAFWLDIVKHHEKLQMIGAIENFSDKDVVVEKGETKKSVLVADPVEVVNAMEQLYMTIVVR